MEKPKRNTRTKEEVPPVVKEIIAMVEQAQEEPKPAGRPRKEIRTPDVIIKIKEVVADVQLLQRTGQITGTIAQRIIRDMGRMITILEKRC